MLIHDCYFVLIMCYHLYPTLFLFSAKLIDRMGFADKTKMHVYSMVYL
jgi:hypothetical protein